MNWKAASVLFGIPLFVITFIMFYTNEAFNAPPTDESSQSASKGTKEAPSGPGFIELFYNTINEKQTDAALSMVDPSFRKDKKAEQDWTDYFSAFESVKLVGAQPVNITLWDFDNQEYKIQIDVKMTPASSSAQIPFYGFDNGVNLRWMKLKRGADNLWRVAGIGTSP